MAGRHAEVATSTPLPPSPTNTPAFAICPRARYNPIWEFGYTIQGTPCDMVFTSVAGHLMELDFTAQHKRWRSCNPVELYQAPVVKAVPDVSAAGVACTNNAGAGWSVLLPPLQHQK